MEIEARPQDSAWRWSLLFSVVLLNVCVPNLVLSYGVVLLHAVQLGVPTWLGLSTPVTHILTYGFTQCWCREAADSWGGPRGYRAMAAAGLLLNVAGLVACGFVPMYVVPFVYGIAGGLGSSLISAQIDAIVFDTYDSHLGIVRGLCLAGQAVGQSLFPHIITALINHYGYSYAHIVLGGIMLQTLPAIMLLKVNPIVTRPVSFSRYSDLSKTYATYSNEVENECYSNEMQLHDLSRKCWKSPSDDNLHRGEVLRIDAGESYTTTTITPPNSPEDTRRNPFGINILPDILEETEESEEDEDDHSDVKEMDINRNKKRYSAAIKRLSTISDNLDDYITKHGRRDSGSDCEGDKSREYSELEVTYDNISPITDIQREKIMKSFSFRCESAYARIRRKFWMPSYRIYRIRRKLQFTMYSINDTFIKPLTRSLSSWRFYPALLLSFSHLSLLAISLVLLPMVASHVHPKISMTESNFLMSLHGFTWLCFLLSTPWLTETPKRNFKYVAVLGLTISTLACFVLAASDSHDAFSIGCVVAGLGFGAISSCWEGAVQDFVGARKWPKLRSTLETLSALLLVTFFVLVCLFTDMETNLQQYLFILGIIISVVTLVWIVIAAVSIYNNTIKMCLFNRFS
ncbi:uncharacterized protein LOC125228531 isoform X1 [Leguminivora glycinivorella]|uniref:uncharacterized protein LOC125228531 isoform X1 n=1 Tax=Leguminivora glycinivorella TaxID=1035111 RepID=UPI002010568C|nr:uncharacterized protein LOC125228531 isoform X1 [Leguminivora glycinivorella]